MRNGLRQRHHCGHLYYFFACSLLLVFAVDVTLGSDRVLPLLEVGDILFREEDGAAGDPPRGLLDDTRDGQVVVGGRGGLLLVFGAILLLFMLFDLIIMVVAGCLLHHGLGWRGFPRRTVTRPYPPRAPKRHHLHPSALLCCHLLL